MSTNNTSGLLADLAEFLDLLPRDACASVGREVQRAVLFHRVRAVIDAPPVLADVQPAPAEAPTESPKREQVIAQCKAVSYMAGVLVGVYNQYAAVLPNGNMDEILDIIGRRTAGQMEYLGDSINGMDATDEADEWLSPIFERAHAMFQVAAIEAQPAPTDTPRAWVIHDPTFPRPYVTDRWLDMKEAKEEGWRVETLIVAGQQAPAEEQEVPGDLTGEPEPDPDFRFRVAFVLTELNGAGVLSEQQCARIYGVGLVEWREIAARFYGAGFVEPGEDDLPEIGGPAEAQRDEAILEAVESALGHYGAEAPREPLSALRGMAKGALPPGMTSGDVVASSRAGWSDASAQHAGEPAAWMQPSDGRVMSSSEKAAYLKFPDDNIWHGFAAQYTVPLTPPGADAAAMVERIAAQWDGCTYESAEIGGSFDIGRDIRAQFGGAAKPAVPADMMLVPREPTEEMLLAGVKAFQHSRYDENDRLNDWRECYRTMIAAAEAAK